ncbi:hypothetical protein TPE_1643 [Treponema pedis str. T A4]|uniref:Uncharacterized protein n=1 Tax=Treponema pedis str. T A4 TaxID=1291379 RepID=S5ZV60_9SPIR|nr:hypothetical protein TPE_1643 [Treponema pedis str. T A4]
MNLIISFAYAKFIRLKPPSSMAGEREKLPAGVAGIRRGRFFCRATQGNARRFKRA